MTAPNLLLIVFDTARADAFEPYGAPPGSSPAVAQLASAGAAAPLTHSTACWTMPAHMSLLSGLLPRSAGFEPAGRMRDYRPQVARLGSRMLPAVLARAGYSTLGLSTNMWVSGVTGFDGGFGEFEFVRGWRARKVSAQGLRTRAAWYLEALRARVDDGAGELAARFEDWLRRSPPRPFFCFVNLVECHSPYLPPRPYNPLAAPDRVRAAYEARRYLNLSSIWKCSTGGFDVPEGAIARMRQLYSASVRQLDDWLARVLEALDRQRLLGDTQVVVTSDHGENLGEGRMLSHAFSLDERLLRVPLVTAGPGSLPPGGLASIRDLPAWLADLAGLAEHPFPALGPGPAVAQFDTPLSPGDPRVAQTLDAWRTPAGARDEVARRLTTSFDCATDGRLKLVRRHGGEELFDLEADPLEERPAAVGEAEERRHGERLAALRGALAAADAELAVARVCEGEGGPAEGQEPSPEELAQLEAQMRMLGYL